ncbi:MAG: dependent pyridine nucleotide-disulfide oxidoreductase family protein [Clostridiaceae bacterium]|jgi:uncharacterized FAD-dependent dehydrogenase|nr:dependent pyridine nucleotide-disulfide oxidoreductase family protein [Clostridiaceae bacterium]
MKYDVIIVGAGPSGIFTAYELSKENKNISILMIEKGKAIENRICPKRVTKRCVNCKPSCRITTGFAGAGAFSDSKLSKSVDVGGDLPQLIGYEKAQKLINETDEVYLKFGGNKSVYGTKINGEIKEIKKKAIENNLKLISCPIRHLGTDGGYKIYTDFQNHLLSSGVNIIFDTMVDDLIIKNNEIKGVKIKSVSESDLINAFDEVSLEEEPYRDMRYVSKKVYSDKVVLAVGREGSEWLENICKYHNINTAVGSIDIGVRVEVKDTIMEKLNKNLYESKLIYYTPTFDDKVRVFCSNPSGEVTTEYYDGNLAVVNGHAYNAKELKTENTNFALLVTQNFKEPFKSPIAYGKHIARLGNMLAGNKIIVQRYGDFKRGRRTTEERLYRNNIIPTLKDAVPGDLSLVLPYRIMKDLVEMIEALNGVVPGLASDELLLYGVEVKFYSNKVIIDENFETNIKGLYGLGDGVGITRGLMQSSAMGLQMGRILSKKNYN